MKRFILVASLLLLIPGNTWGDKEIEIHASMVNRLRLPSIMVNLQWGLSGSHMEERSLSSPLSVLSRLKSKYLRLPASTSNLERGKKIIELRRWSLRAGKWEPARKYLNQAIDLLTKTHQQKPTGELAFWLGRLYSYRRDYAKKRKFMEESHRLEPDNPDLYELLLPHPRERKQFHQLFSKWNPIGNQYFKKKIKETPKNAELYYKYCLFLIASFYSEADSNDYPLPMTAKFKKFTEMGKKSNLRYFLDQAIKMDPDEPRYHLFRAGFMVGLIFFRGMILAQKQMQQFRTKKQYTNAMAKVFLNSFGLQIRRYSKDVKIIESDLEYLYKRRIFGYVSLFSYLGLLQAMKGEIKLAEKYYQEGMLYHQDYKKYYWELAGFYVFFLPHNSVLFHKITKRLSHRMFKNRFLKLDPKDYLMISKFLFRGKDWKEALQVIELGLRSFPRDTSLRLTRAICLFRVGRLKAANQALQQVQPSRREKELWALTSYTRGLFLIHMGKVGQGLDLMETALTTNPGLAEAANILILFGR